MALTKYEQETTVSMNREDDFVQIYSVNARHIRAMKADDRFVVHDDFFDEETGEVESVTARISTQHFDPLTGLKRRQKPMSDEQKAIVAARLTAAREAKKIEKGLVSA